MICVEKIVDIENIVIDTSLSKEEKVENFVKDIINPYKFKAGGIVVNVAFDQNGSNLQDKMMQYFRLIMT